MDTNTAAPSRPALAFGAFCAFCAVWVAISADSVHAAGAPSSAVSGAGDSAAPSGPVRAEPQRWGLVPILMSTAETGLQAGLLVMRFLPTAGPLDKPSTLGLAARISQKGQAQINFFPEWYLRHNLYHVAGELNYLRWPADFYGIGNDQDRPKDSADAYTAEGANGNLIAERRWLKDFSAGPMAAFSRENIESGGKHGLLTPDIAGATGGLAIGLGGQATYDGRDAVYWARRGAFLRAKALLYRAAWGSDYAFEAYGLEARRFFPLFAIGALGFAATLQAHTGNAPFRELATADGDHAMRGIVRGKYRDRDLLLVQAEYKSYLPDWGWLQARWLKEKLGFAVFAETGQVAPGLGDFSLEGMRPAYGLGLRYAMNPERRMNIRIDLGFVDETIAPAINIKEAF